MTNRKNVDFYKLEFGATQQCSRVDPKKLLDMIDRMKGASASAPQDVLSPKPDALPRAS